MSMYLFEEMIDVGVKRWKSSTHRDIAITLLIGNPRIDRCSELERCCSVINKLTTKRVKEITIADVAAMGIPIN